MEEKTFAELERTGYELSESEKESLLVLLSKGCRAKNKEKLQGRIVNRFFYSRFAYWMKERLEIRTGIVYYTAGQSYTDEIKFIRDYVLNH